MLKNIYIPLSPDFSIADSTNFKLFLEHIAINIPNSSAKVLINFINEIKSSPSLESILFLIPSTPISDNVPFHNVSTSRSVTLKLRNT